MSASLLCDQYRNMAVFVALRDHHDAAFRFRPATVLSIVRECAMYVISTTVPGTGSDAAPGTQCLAVVDRGQIMHRWPFSEAPLLAKSSGILYTRHEILLGPAQFPYDTVTDARRFVETFGQLYTAHPSLMDMEDSCRFDMRVSSDRYTFIVVGGQKDTATINWTVETLRRILEKHATFRAILPAVNMDITEGCLEGSGSSVRIDDQKPNDSGTFCRAACLCHLPHILLTEVLEYLDVHAQAQASRVCALWQEILGYSRATPHICLSSENFTCTPYGEHNCCRIAMMLVGRLTGRTKSVTITARALDWTAELFNWHIARWLPEFLEVMDIKLPFFVMKSFCLTYMVPEVLNAFEQCCNQLVLDQLTMREGLFGEMRAEVLTYRRSIPLPDRERRFATAEASLVTAQSVVDGTLICPPRLFCKWRDGWEHIFHRFMWAMDGSLPAATAHVYARVEVVRTRWRNTLAYPDEWQTFVQ
ncbi:uncharacterized protein LOC129601853 [Paramacrobiotus metropolitanus]|uniref:uncharacterized protein LOC129601853 n=1 Tax=Paramacrobiotus metropolitanus TaxID=2943436 RepID=UPI0024458B78|nr:uncharacterized protein LOC129601853 [Paramacrobiotus metropolitanus]